MQTRIPFVKNSILDVWQGYEYTPGMGFFEHSLLNK